MEIEKNLYDAVIVGGGPAGLSAAIYLARAKYRVLVVDKNGTGGQIAITSEVVNYPGIEKISGKELTASMRRQAENFGAEFVTGEVLHMELEKEIKEIKTTRGDYKALGVILATGANPRKIGFKGEREFQGRGVAYCATCDGEFFTGKKVFVIGGGFAAVEEAIFLTRYAREVTILVRGDSFSCAKTVSDQLENYDKIDVKFHTELVEADGDQLVTRAEFYNNQTKETWEYEAGADGNFGIFVFAGYVPNTEWIGPEVEKNEQGYLLTDSNQKTNLDGVYAAGDVCVKQLRQVVTAVSDGATAATSLEKAAAELHTKLNLPDLVQEKTAETAVEDETPGLQENGFFDASIYRQLEPVFRKFEQKVKIRAWLDDQPLSGEIRGFLRELTGMTDQVTWEEIKGSEGRAPMLPAMELCYENGQSSGIWFHGVPGGHEFNSFVVALYNTAGPGQEISPELEERIRKIDQPVNIKVLVSLSCTMCPELVMASQKAASVSDKIEAEMFDLMHYSELKEKYQLMSVPCMIINDKDVYFGKKNLEELIGILEGE